MKLFYTFILFLQIFCIMSSYSKKQSCACDKTEPYKCECNKCNCDSED